MEGKPHWSWEHDGERSREQGAEELMQGAESWEQGAANNVWRAESRKNYMYL